MFATLWLARLAGLCVIYVVPSIIAFRRGHANRWAILIANVCLGGTGLGWASALIWVLNAVQRWDELAGSHTGASGLNVSANDMHRVRIVKGSESRTRADGAKLTTAAVVAEIERLSTLRAAGL